MRSTLHIAKRSGLWLTVLITGCGQPPGPPLTATDIVAFAPLHGGVNSAAYLTIHNLSQEAITIQRVSSPQFAKVEIHESTIVDNVARMRRLDSLTVDAGAQARFVSGGKHLMLIEPIPGVVAGSPVTLQFEYNVDGILIVNTALKSRM